ncbi:MAG: NUDIX hydrolase [Planctomycetota bacterium]|nr:MAG: NUDIX hydrolase [Planctomycetota bacterium]
MSPHPDIRVEHSARVYTGRFFHLLKDALRLPSGRKQELEVLVHPGAVCIAPLLDNGELLLVRQYRHAIGDWLLELPAGRLEQGGAEDRLAAARRELEEETGHVAAQWESLGEICPAPGFCSERIELFLAREVRPVVGAPRPADEDEEFELVRARPRELLHRTSDAKTLVAAAWLIERGARTARELSAPRTRRPARRSRPGRCATRRRSSRTATHRRSRRARRRPRARRPRAGCAPG